MTKIKKIYYPVLAVLFVLALVLGLVATHVDFGTKADKTFANDVRRIVDLVGLKQVHNSYEEVKQKSVREDIKKMLVANDIYVAGGSKTDNYEGAEIDGVSLVIQEVTLDNDSIAHMQQSDDELTYVIRNLYNIIVVVPGKSEDAVLFTANYDTAAYSQSGIESIQAAAMLQTILSVAKDYDSGKQPENTLVFVLTDAEHEGALGAYAFRYQFKGFDGIADKVKLAVNFGAQGTGALAVSTDKLSVSAVKGLASGLSDAIDSTYDGVSDYDVYDVAKINVFFSGSRDYINTSRDTVDAVSDSKIRLMGGVMSSLVSAYGYGKIEEGKEGGAFSYMGLTLSYSNTIAYVLGAVAAVLLVLAIFAIIRSGKKFNGLLRGILIQLVTVIVTAAILYVCYLLLTLILAGFGVVPINAIATVRYMNIGLFVSSLLLAFAAYTGVFLLIRKFFKVKVTDAARGGAIIISLLGIVLAFVMPSAAITFVLTAVLEDIALILTSLLSNKFRAKHEADIERLFIYTIPLILLTPAVIPLMMLATYSLSVVYYPLIFTAAVIGFSVIAPYFGLLKSTLSKVASRLPKHTIRVEREVTEQVEGPKKGRYQEVTHKKVVNEKVEWTYRNRYGVAILSVFAAVLIILFAVCPANHFDTNIVDAYSYRESAKNNSLVYYWEENANGEEAIEKLRIYDQVAYSYFGRIDKGFTWNSSIKAYEKDFPGDSSSIHSTNSVILISMDSDNKELKFTPYDSVNESFIDLTLTNVANVTKLTIKPNQGNEIEIENDGNSTVKLQFPYNSNEYREFTISFECTGALNVDVDYYQYASGSRTLQKLESLEEYKDIIRGFKDKDFVNEITCGMIFHKGNSFRF